jgi:hypothetical protein
VEGEKEKEFREGPGGKGMLQWPSAAGRMRLSLSFLQVLALT